MAVGVDIDRKFYDFPTAGFIESLFQQVRESWAIKLDAKVRAYTTAQAAPALTDEPNVASPAIAAQNALLKAAAVAVRALKRRRVGAATWVLVTDEDMFTLLDVEITQVLAYLKLFGIDPEQFRSTDPAARRHRLRRRQARRRPSAPCPAPRSASTPSTSPTAASTKRSSATGPSRSTTPRHRLRDLHPRPLIHHPRARAPGTRARPVNPNPPSTTT